MTDAQIANRATLAIGTLSVVFKMACGCVVTVETKHAYDRAKMDAFTREHVCPGVAALPPPG